MSDRKYQEGKVVGPATAIGVAPGTSAIIATIQAPLEADVYLRYYGWEISPTTNQKDATFNFLINGTIYRTDATPFGSLGIPMNLPSPPKIGRGCKIELQGVMAASAVGITDMKAVAGLVFVAPGDVLNV